MKQPIVIIGIGELASVFVKAFLRNGYPVYPITRNMDMAKEAKQISNPQAVLVAVGEKDFPIILGKIPQKWRDCLIFIQNEILPHDWECFNFDGPTIMSVWFEKKKGMDYNQILPSPIYGQQADIISSSLSSINISTKILYSNDELIFELMLKNLFVITINIAGLMLPDAATTSILWEDNNQLALDIAFDVISIQEKLSGKKFPKDQLIEGFRQAIDGDHNHICRGRSALNRLQRAINSADKFDLKVKKIRDINKYIKENI